MKYSGTDFSSGEDERDKGKERAEVSIVVMLCSIKSAILQIVLNDHIGDSIEDELDVGCISSTREVRVNLFLVTPLVQTFKFHLDVSCTFLVSVGTYDNK